MKDKEPALLRIENMGAEEVEAVEEEHLIILWLRV